MGVFGGAQVRAPSTRVSRRRARSPPPPSASPSRRLALSLAPCKTRAGSPPPPPPPLLSLPRELSRNFSPATCALFPPESAAALLPPPGCLPPCGPPRASSRARTSQSVPELPQRHSLRVYLTAPRNSRALRPGPPELRETARPRARPPGRARSHPPAPRRPFPRAGNLRKSRIFVTFDRGIASIPVSE